MYPSLWHPHDIYAAETSRRYLIEAEQQRLARQVPCKPSTLRPRLATFLRSLADLLDCNQPSATQVVPAPVTRVRSVPRLRAVV